MKSNMADHLEGILNLPREEIVVTSNNAVEVFKEHGLANEDPEKNDLENDYEFARENIRNLIDVSAGTLEEITELARQSQSPRVYEVLAQLTKTLAEANKDLLEVHSKTQDIKRKSVDSTFNKSSKVEHADNVNQAVFVGNSSELLELLKLGKADK